MMQSRLFLVAAAAISSAAFGCGGSDQIDGSTSTTGGAITGAGGADSGSGGHHQSSSTGAMQTSSAGGAGGGSGCQVAPSTDPLVVPTQFGAIRGKQDGNTLAFLGVPYSAPPTGDLRFRPPTDPACWSDVKDTTDYGSACIQDLPSGSKFGDEDCLYLNVWTPKLGGAKRPVLFFVHGGAYLFGSGSQDLLIQGTGNLYEGQSLADANNVVVVTINYRLGEVGFLAHPALSAEDPHSSSGNYGTLDQIAALKWVQNNISNFGGDPGDVMLYGESAGGLSTCLLLTSPLAKGLYAKALVESGGCTVASQESRFTQGRGIVDQAGCTSATDIPACLRAASVDDFRVPPPSGLAQFLGPDGDITSVWDMPYGPNIDNYVFKEQPLDAIKAGRHEKVPLTVGSNGTEFRLFLPPGSVNTCTDYYTVVAGLFGDLADNVLGEYGCFDQGPLPYDTAIAVGTDFMFTCTARRILKAAAMGGTPASYRYYDPHAYTNSPLTPLGSFHASELPYVFNTFDVMGYTPTDGDKALSAAMGSYWSQFAKTGNPNVSGLANWPTWEPDADVAIKLDDTISTAAKVESAHCDFWDNLVGF